jgi:hypothetical protein
MHVYLHLGNFLTIFVVLTVYHSFMYFVTFEFFQETFVVHRLLMVY